MLALVDAVPGPISGSRCKTIYPVCGAYTSTGYARSGFKETTAIAFLAVGGSEIVNICAVYSSIVCTPLIRWISI